MEECSYYYCNRKGENLPKCEYCGEPFCEEHLLPKPPSISDFLKKYPEKKGHPCIAYVQYLREEEMKREEEYKQTLKELL
ncbi:MAG: hypothetical protein GXN92_00070, partial [Candidatus Micrarchaeota archaeon]|nr:hypothetical protein [Candidatus Micrarchaeota archaeon]